ncbi:hypothetical protein [Parapontixanthobacter aurantiacus]|uniref:hypothetical protein n=1 Tax=Parapontixanthobacter aurantiacus TaxID=1463599 RepID=UPI001927A107|nr:hypothetical protein [Parapontixanthobacter aurantiacus]
MNEHQIVSLVALLGFLILAGSALIGHRLSWKRGVVMATGWLAIFAIVFLFFNLIAG